MDDQVDEDFSITPGHLEQRIESELESYAGLNMTAEYKEKSYRHIYSQFSSKTEKKTV